MTLHADVKAPIRSLSFTDDPIANRRRPDDLPGYRTSARITREQAGPAESSRKPIGHPGFFRPDADTVLRDRRFDGFVTPRDDAPTAVG